MLRDLLFTKLLKCKTEEDYLCSTNASPSDLEDPRGDKPRVLSSQ
jgi:hypothetical protein